MKRRTTAGKLRTTIPTVSDGCVVRSYKLMNDVFGFRKTFSQQRVLWSYEDDCILLIEAFHQIFAENPAANWVDSFALQKKIGSIPQILLVYVVYAALSRASRRKEHTGNKLGQIIDQTNSSRFGKMFGDFQANRQVKGSVNSDRFQKVPCQKAVSRDSQLGTIDVIAINTPYIRDTVSPKPS